VIPGATEHPSLTGRPPRRLQLELTDVPDDVARARHAVGRFALDAGLDHLEIGAVELAVGEACANVVRHAYGPSSGAMLVDATADGERMQVSVCDHGAGIRRRISGGRTGLGTAIMIALCDTLEVGSGPDGTGTRLTMTFAL
jgi:anti-sigma regulatory factor (Ser/Thr protein kinase)